jgi:SAM-dependent methyltransferase
MNKLFSFLRSVVCGEINYKMLKYHFMHRVIWQHDTIVDDDFDWDNYTLHYKGELEVGAKKRTTVLSSDDYQFENRKLVQKGSRLPLHNNAQLLYETILLLSPESVLEIGCGGGDNLRNLNTLNSSFELFGVDISNSQLELFKQRHPELPCSTAIADAALPGFCHKQVDLIYTQAVIMHIGEKDGRHIRAFENAIKTSRQYLVLIENWEKHDFFGDVNDIFAKGVEGWDDYFLYYRESEISTVTKVMIISKVALDFPPLTDNGQLIS